ncbi:MAG: DHHA1 domain-containing protein, partial [Pseudomonadota bacterium]|nr:DHHA1 domain-containing protein [Pseudomonadota bacterium]
DFSHFEAVTAEQLAEIERRVNQEIRANHTLATELMDLDEAKASGAMALFGEKYDEKVRVVTMGPFSVELCGGTHVTRTGDIGLFKITSEAGIASGVRRIEAVTGEHALEVVQTQQATLSSLSALLKTDSQNVLDRVVSLQNQTKELEKALNSAKQKLASQQGADMLSNAVEINGVKVLIANLEGVEAKSLRSMMDDIKNRIGEGIVVLGVANDAKVNLIAGVTKNLTSKVKAGELVNFVASQVGGKGGGRPDMAQAGGDQPENLGQALDSVNAWLQDKL